MMEQVFDYYYLQILPVPLTFAPSSQIDQLFLAEPN
jgi:hypothetical protein